MPFFQQYQGSRLYLPTTSGDSGWLGYQLPPPPPQSPPPPPTIELQDALSVQPGSFLFSATPPDFTPPGALKTFIDAIDGVIQAQVTSRGILWFANPANPGAGTPPFLGMDSGGTVRSALTAPIVQTPGVIMLSIVVTTNTPVKADDTSLTLAGQNILTWGGASAPQASQINAATIFCAGALRGCVQFSTFIQRQSLHDNLNWGFQFMYPSFADPVHKAVAAWLPLAAGSLPSPSDQIGFTATVDPSDPLGRVIDRTNLTFTGQNLEPNQTTVLVSDYRTTYGAPINFTPSTDPLGSTVGPARLVFHSGAATDDGGERFQASPAGDFILSLDSAAPGASYDLMCGVQGTEYVAFQPVTANYAGDRVRFKPRQPAFAGRYPFTPSSPVGPPVDPTAPLLDSTYLTSWATIVRLPGTSGANPYIAQPRGASLYGRDALIHGTTQNGNGNAGAGSPTLFGPMDPSVVLPDERYFPMAPFAGFTPGDGLAGMNKDQSERFEREVIGPQRRMQIGAAKPAPSKASALAPAAQATGAPAKFTTTTPTGLLVSLDDGTWTKVLLGQNSPPPSQAPSPHVGDSPFRQMYFCQPNAALQQALQSGQLFQVAANAVNLGAPSDGGFGDCGSGPTFFNRMNVGAWDMAADVGQNNRYDDYTNVLIIKGRKGPLYDPSAPATSLVANPDQWTQKDAFAAPSDLRVDPQTGEEVVGPPDPTEMTILSGWLQRYFADAAMQTDTDYFANFNRIAIDKNWTGILVLRARIANIPTDLAGIMAGVTAPELFFAHHLAIEISPVANDPAATDIQLSSPSSVFGLIYYVDPSFTPPAKGETAQPVPPAAGTDYDFRLLTLKVLFQNTAVQRFQSWAQLTLNRFFGMRVTRMGGAGANPYNTVVLAGTYQNNNGKPLYSLATQADSTFFFDDNNIVRKIEVQSAAMSTLNAGTQATNPTVMSWFGLTALIDFHTTQQVVDPGDKQPKIYYPFDVFSFGSDDSDGPDGKIGKGLAFTNLGVLMTFPVGDSTQRAFSLNADQLRFDITRSTPRTGSLFQNFALQVEGLVQGTTDTTPSSAGFLGVIPDVVFSGVDGDAWTGIQYSLSLGTPGALAGNVGLTSQLLTAWSPASTGDATYRAAIGLQLPGTGGGAKLISLQSVLKLSIGQLRLARDRDKSSFLLMLSEVALKFLGFLKLPPSGSTLFYLFGNPKSDGKPSGLGWYAMYKK